MQNVISIKTFKNLLRVKKQSGNFRGWGYQFTYRDIHFLYVLASDRRGFVTIIVEGSLFKIYVFL